jgi:hypothetical protein
MTVMVQEKTPRRRRDGREELRKRRERIRPNVVPPGLEGGWYKPGTKT